jgi:hypothetical protein
MRNKRHWHKVIELLRDKPHEVGAEIGVHKGLFASRVLKNLPGIKTYYCIDPWEFYGDYVNTLRHHSAEAKTPKANVYRIFLRNTKIWQHKRIIIRATSMEALSQIQDESLDWVFIDANHAYKYCKQDIVGWDKKLKVGGLLSGHDFYNAPNPIRKIQFGVGKAVKELVPNFQVERGPNVWWAWKEHTEWIKE